MQRKFISFAIFAVITLVVWIYWSSNLQLNDTVIIIKEHNYYKRDYSVEPAHTICKHKPFIIIIVTSYVGHVELRSAHRRAMPQELLKSLNISRIFMLAKIPSHEKYITQAAIVDENNIYGDILQGSFIENYRNLTYKHIMGLKWASTVCNKASFILKVDDDTVFSIERTYSLLSKETNRDLLMGYILNGTKPKRKKQNKWYVTHYEYQRSEYPPYLSGWYYITTPSTAAKLCDEAIYHNYFWIDDIFITGLLAESLNIKLKSLPQDYWLEYYELLECCLRDMIVKSINCEYVVGPNGNRNELIVEFNKAIRHCDSWKNCTMRPLKKSLKKSCIVNRERTIFSDGGKAEIQNINL